MFHVKNLNHDHRNAEKIRFKVTEQYILKNIPKCWNVLDIGINTGGYWHNTPFNVVGLDKEPHEKVTIIHDIEKPFTNMLKDYWPIITMFEVIEHVDNPILVFKHIKSILRDDGLFLGSTPNRLHIIDQIKRYMGFHHNYFFDRVTLKHLLHKAGFKNIKIEVKVWPLPRGIHTHFNFDLYPFLRLGRVLFWKCTK